MARGAPLGNKRALDNKGAWGDKPWTDALRRAIVQQDGKAHVLLTAEHTGEPLTIQLVSFSALPEISANESDTPAEYEQAALIPARR